MDNGRKTTIILDSSHHGMRLIYGCKKEDTAEEAYQMWRYLFLNGIFNYIEKFNANEFILAIDSRDNWRKKVFKFYKGDRKIKRKKDDEDDSWFNFNEYYKQYNKLINDIVNNFPIKVIQTKYSEADDIAGVLCESKELKDNVKILITTDGDYVQLLSFPFVRIFNPIKKEFIKIVDPKKELLRKIILGDVGDYVPSIQDSHRYKPEFLTYCVKIGIAKNESNAKIKLENDENLLISTELSFLDKYGIKASRVMKYSKKKANAMIEENNIMEFLQKKENIILKKKFIRNNKLVNLIAQPKEIKNDIIKTYNNYKLKNGINKIFDFFILNSFNEFIHDTTRLGNILEPLCDYK